MVSNTSRKDYYVSNALEITPNPNKELKSVLGAPIMNRKLKYTLLESSLVASNATSATPLSLVTVSQGTTDITRTGDRIRMRRLWFSAKLYGAAAATGPYTTRVLIVCWNPVGSGAVNAPVSGQIIQHAANFGPYGSYSRDFGDCYQVVYDAMYSVNPVSATSENEILHLDRKICIDAEFTAGATVPTVNNLYLFLLCENATNTPTLTFSSTVWYEDLDS